MANNFTFNPYLVNWFTQTPNYREMILRQSMQESANGKFYGGRKRR